MPELHLIHVTDPADPRIADYTNLTDVVLRSRHEPAKGLYIAESSSVIHRALEAGHRPRSFLMAERWLADLEPAIAALGDDLEPVPVYLGEPEVLRRITGFHLHRGALAAMHRPPLEPVCELLGRLAGARRIAVFEDIVDHTNLGAAFRSAAALGVDAVLVTPRSADPLYRRSVRVSMGTVFQVPWTRLDDWPGDLALLRGAGYATAALALDKGATTLDDLAADLPGRLALIFGTEGDGLGPATVAAADRVVRIPMSGGVDSLNVAAAAAVAFWATRPR